MKLYSRKNLILGLVCCLLVIFEYKHFDPSKSVVWMGFFGFMAFRLIRAAFNKEAYEQEEEQTEREKRVTAKMGPVWRFPALVIIAPPLVGAGIYALVWPSQVGVFALLLGLVGSVVLAALYRRRYNELMEQEEQNEENKS